MVVRGVRPGRAMSGVPPFAFHGCLEVRELLPWTARDARELLEALQAVPDQAIFSHTAGVLLRRLVLAEAYPNDFALWADGALGDRRLAERLAVVDLSDAGTVEAVRTQLMATIEDHLRHGAPAVRASEPFAFIQYHLVPVATGLEATTLREFREALAQVDASALFFHLVEARYRLGRRRGDFVEWIASALERTDLAERLGGLDPQIGSLERVRDRYLTVLDAALETER